MSSLLKFCSSQGPLPLGQVSLDFRSRIRMKIIKYILEKLIERLDDIEKELYLISLSLLLCFSDFCATRVSYLQCQL